MVEFKRKKGESFESFLRRFNRSLIKSQKLNLARRKKFLNPKANKAKKKEQALLTKKIQEKNEFLRKTGKLKEEPKRRW